MGAPVVKLALVVGTVVSTINVPVYDDRTLLLCDLVSADGSVAGGYLIAVDTVGAGVGETVLLMDEGNSARQILAARDAPVRALVVGIVDHVELAAAESGTSPVAPTGKSKAARAASARPARRSRGGGGQGAQ
jgi:ethanolamine utilization protein EutN